MTAAREVLFARSWSSDTVLINVIYRRLGWRGCIRLEPAMHEMHCIRRRFGTKYCLYLSITVVHPYLSAITVLSIGWHASTLVDSPPFYYGVTRYYHSCYRINVTCALSTWRCDACMLALNTPSSAITVLAGAFGK